MDSSHKPGRCRSRQAKFHYGHQRFGNDTEQYPSYTLSRSTSARDGRGVVSPNRDVHDSHPHNHALVEFAFCGNLVKNAKVVPELSSTGVVGDEDKDDG